MRDRGRRPYLTDKEYVAAMRDDTDFWLEAQRKEAGQELRKHSELKKPYWAPSYNEMEAVDDSPPWWPSMPGPLPFVPPPYLPTPPGPRPPSPTPTPTPTHVGIIFFEDGGASWMKPVLFKSSSPYVEDGGTVRTCASVGFSMPVVDSSLQQPLYPFYQRAFEMGGSKYYFVQMPISLATDAFPDGGTAYPDWPFTQQWTYILNTANDKWTFLDLAADTGQPYAWLAGWNYGPANLYLLVSTYGPAPTYTQTWYGLIYSWDGIAATLQRSRALPSAPYATGGKSYANTQGYANVLSTGKVLLYGMTNDGVTPPVSTTYHALEWDIDAGTFGTIYDLGQTTQSSIPTGYEDLTSMAIPYYMDEGTSGLDGMQMSTSNLTIKYQFTTPAPGVSQEETWITPPGPFSGSIYTYQRSPNPSTTTVTGAPNIDTANWAGLGAWYAVGYGWYPMLASGINKAPVHGQLSLGGSGYYSLWGSMGTGITSRYVALSGLAWCRDPWETKDVWHERAYGSSGATAKAYMNGNDISATIASLIGTTIDKVLGILVDVQAP